MNELWAKFKGAWTHLAWLVAAIVVMMDAGHVEEWAKQHEVWGGVIVAIWTVLLAWAQKSRLTAKSSGGGTAAPRRVG